MTTLRIFVTLCFAARQCRGETSRADLLTSDSEIGGSSFTCRQAVRGGSPATASSFQLADLAWNIALTH